MRRKFIKIVCRLLMMTAVTMLPMSCSDVEKSIDEALEGSEPQLVGFYAGGAQTRTEMLDNGLSAVWVADDRIALWAIGSSGSYVLSNQVFKTYGLDSQRGFFTTELASAMPDDTYTYYCCYPVPSSVNGTKANLYVPTVQDGKVTGGADIMVATPVQHGALAPVPEPEDHLGMSMTMNRMMHQFRFYVDEGGAKLNGAAISRMKVSFPFAVVGNVQVELDDPTKSAVLTSGYKDVTLNLKEPITFEDGNYACMAFVRTKFTEGQSIQINAYTSDKIVKIDPIDLCARDFKAGRSTPVRLIIQDVVDYPYVITFKVVSNNLGEGVNTVVLTAPAGCEWEKGGSNVYHYTPGHKITAGENIVFRFEDEAQYRAFSNKTISVTYDSDNTLTYQSVTVPDISSNNHATLSLTIPYLFFEDFSGIPSFSDGHDNPKVGTASDTYKGISELTSNSLAGWYGARIGGQSGTSIRICCRYEHVLLAGAYYKGRVYTPFLSNIKDGANVNISVSFRYGSNRSERDPLFGSPPKKNPILYFGINSEDAVTNPDATEGGLIEDITGLVGGIGYASWADSSLNPRAINGEELNNFSGSYTSFTGTKNVVIENVDNGMRLGWIVSTNNTSSNTNGNYWLYLDDIKVQVASNN